MCKKGVKAAKYREERYNGLTYREIAEKYGVSYQCVAQTCSKYNPSYFRFHNEKNFVYPNLCKWLNDNKVSICELLRRMGLTPTQVNHERFRNICVGRSEPRKSTIDKLISVTGLPYEELFAVVDRKGGAE